MKTFLQHFTKGKKFKKVISAITASLVICTTIGTVPLTANAVGDDPAPLLKYDNIKIATESQAVDISSNIDQLKNLEEGTIIVRFKPNADASIMDLFSISNSNYANVYYALYVKPGSVGFEARTRVDGVDTSLGDINGSYSADFKAVNTVALKVDKTYGYKIFFNGKLVKDQSSTSVYFFKNIFEANKAAIGKIFRNNSSSWLYNGYIDSLSIYNTPLDDNYLLSKTAETYVNPDADLPAGVVKTNPINLTYPGLLNSNYFRIPALITSKTGKVIAGVDVRYNSAADTPNPIDIGIRTSTDGGNSWDAGKIVIRQADKGSSIDSVLFQDNSTGRIFLAADIVPSGYYFGNAKQGSGYETINGVKYLNLYDNSGNKYTVRENGIVYNSAGAATNYTMNDVDDVFLNGTKVGNAFHSSCPLKVFGSFHIKYVYSDDDGVTWSKPVNITSQTKPEWSKFFGTGPGRGLQLKVGQYAGRLVFPVYYTNVNGKQSSALVYSDDHGQTWKLGESPNDGRITGSTSIDSKTLNSSTYELTEAQVVEMPDGQLKLFCRNYGGKVAVATSFDGGVTWDNTVEKDSVLNDPYCQMSVINYSKKVDGYDALIFSNPNASNRSNGTVRIGLIKDSGTKYANGRTRYDIEWKYSKTIKADAFGYSCLTELPNGNIGIFYEGTGNQIMPYTEMNLEYIKYNPTTKSPTLQQVQFGNDRKDYSNGDILTVKYIFDERVMAVGQRNLTSQVGTYNVPLTMTQSADGKELIFQGNISSIPVGSYDVKTALPTALEVFNMVGGQYPNTGAVQTVGRINIVANNVPVLNAKDSYTQVNLSWSAVANAVTYDVYRSDSSAGTYTKIGANSTNSYTDAAITANKFYYYKVQAVYSGGTKSAFSNIISAGTFKLSYMLNGSERTFDGTKTITGTSNDLNTIKDLRKGTIIMRFRTVGSAVTTTNSIFSATNTTITTGSIPEQSFFIDRSNFRYQTGGVAKANITTTPALNDGQWHTIIYMTEGTEATSGVDGVANGGVGSATTVNSAYNRKWILIDGVEYLSYPNLRKFFGDQAGLNTLTIGGRVGGASTVPGAATEANFKGEIDYVAITDKIYTLEEAKALTAK